MQLLACLTCLGTCLLQMRRGAGRNRRVYGGDVLGGAGKDVVLEAVEEEGLTVGAVEVEDILAAPPAQLREGEGVLGGAGGHVILQQHHVRLHNASLRGVGLCNFGFVLECVWLCLLK